MKINKGEYILTPQDLRNLDTTKWLTDLNKGETQNGTK